MKTCLPILAVLAALVLSPQNSLSQQASSYQIKKVTPSVIRTPDYGFSGEKRRSETGQWLEVEVEFTSAVPWTDELTFKYYININNSLLVGEVTHVNIPSGENISVMYVAPGTLNRAMQGKALTNSAIENIGVEILKQGAVQSVASFKNAQPGWWQRMTQIPNLVLNKNQTPFAPLYWDRYPEIKSQSR